MRYKVMKATGALPTEERVQRMNDQQWLWYYLNILEDEKQEEKKWKNRLDYVGWWINPKLAKSVMEHEKINSEDNSQNQNQNPQSYQNGDEIIVEGDKAVNDSFEAELKKALSEAGIDENQFTELPDSNSAGNQFESKDDFINRVIANQDLNIPKAPINKLNKPQEPIKTPEEVSLEEQLKKAGINPDDLDYFEYSDE